MGIDIARLEDHVSSKLEDVFVKLLMQIVFCVPCLILIACGDGKSQEPEAGTPTPQNEASEHPNLLEGKTIKIDSHDVLFLSPENVAVELKKIFQIKEIVFAHPSINNPPMVFNVPDYKYELLVLNKGQPLDEVVSKNVRDKLQRMIEEKIQVAKDEGLLLIRKVPNKEPKNISDESFSSRYFVIPLKQGATLDDLTEYTAEQKAKGLTVY